MCKGHRSGVSGVLARRQSRAPQAPGRRQWPGGSGAVAAGRGGCRSTEPAGIVPAGTGMTRNSAPALACAALAALLAACTTAPRPQEQGAGKPAGPAQPDTAALAVVQSRVEAGDAAGAATAYEKSFGNPQTAADAVLYASLLRAAGRDAEARAVLEAALAREPANADVLYALSMLEQAEGNADRGKDLLARALAADPGHADAAAATGEAERAAGRRAAAADLFARALARDPRQPLALLGVARIAFAAGDYAAAEKGFSAVIDAHPDISTAWFGRALARRRMGNDAGALADYDRGLQLDPESVWDLVDRGRLLLEMGRTAQGQADFERAVALDPGGFVAHVHLAGIHYKAARWAESRREFETSVRLNPEYNAAYSTLGELCWRLADPAAAAKWYRQAYERRPQEPAYALLAAVALRRSGKAADAIELLRPVAAAIARESWYHVAAEYLMRPDWDTPVMDHLRNERNETAKKRLLFYLGVEYLAIGRKQAALTYLLDAASLEGDQFPEKQLASWEVEHAN
jgi:tetratricopeptide (TPR) repeat protein